MSIPLLRSWLQPDCLIPCHGLIKNKVVDYYIPEKMEMEMDQGKLFVGGISWDTSEERLKEYFGTYGEVVEAVIMRDRITCLSRGFGFVVFSDPAVAELVVKEKHTIDGRTVEAKKAVPRDDSHLINRNAGSTHGSPGPGSTKKIFVGGLPSTITENDFKTYFDQFGTITDVVVMYDHNTQRPRGFGFITYDSEDTVDRVLYKTFHELNGKMVEVKRAVPKEISPGPNRSPLLGNHYGSYGVRMDGRYNSLANARTGFSNFGCPNLSLGMNMEQGLNPGFGGGSSFSGNLAYGRVLNPYVSSNQSRYNTPIGYNASSSRGDSLLNSSSRNVWGNGGIVSPNNTSTGSYFGSGSDIFGVFGNNASIWDASPIPTSLEGNTSGFNGVHVGNRVGGSTYAQGSGGFGRNSGTVVGSTLPFTGSRGAFGGFYNGGSFDGDLTWQSTFSEMDNSGSFNCGFGNPEETSAKDSDDYLMCYGISSRQSGRGIAA